MIGKSQLPENIRIIIKKQIDKFNLWYTQIQFLKYLMSNQRGGLKLKMLSVYL